MKKGMEECEPTKQSGGSRGAENSPRGLQPRSKANLGRAPERLKFSNCVWEEGQEWEVGLKTSVTARSQQRMSKDDKPKTKLSII